MKVGDEGRRDRGKRRNRKGVSVRRRERIESGTDE